MIRFKIDVLEALKNKGYTTTRIRKEKIIPEGTLTRIRKNQGEPVTTATINILCSILKKQPGQLLEFIPDDKTGSKQDEPRRRPGSLQDFNRVKTGSCRDRFGGPFFMRWFICSSCSKQQGFNNLLLIF